MLSRKEVSGLIKPLHCPPKESREDSALLCFRRSRAVRLLPGWCFGTAQAIEPLFALFDQANRNHAENDRGKQQRDGQREDPSPGAVRIVFHCVHSRHCAPLPARSQSGRPGRPCLSDSSAVTGRARCPHRAGVGSRNRRCNRNAARVMPTRKIPVTMRNFGVSSRPRWRFARTVN